jgi:hypothetical protein
MAPNKKLLWSSSQLHKPSTIEVTTLKQDSCYDAVNGTTFWGHFFKGAYLPQKSEFAPPLDREGMPVQKYVTSYLTKFTPIWFK